MHLKKPKCIRLYNPVCENNKITIKMDQMLTVKKLLIKSTLDGKVFL